MALKLVPPGKRKYRTVYSVRGRYLGTAVEESAQTSDRRVALVYLREVEKRIEAEAKDGAGPVTFAHAAEQFIGFRKPRKIDEAHIRRLFPFIGEKPVGQIRHADLVAAANTLLPHHAPQTKNRCALGLAARVLHYAADNQWCPWLRVKMFKEPRPQTKAVSLATSKRLIAAAPAGERRFLLLWLFRTGMRIGDVLRLQWKNIDRKRGVLCYHVRKTDTYRERRLHLDLLNYPIKAGEPDDFIFPWRYPQGVGEWLRPLARSVGVDFTPHMARHSLGKWLNESGASLRTIMDQLDHTSPDSSIRYQSTDLEVLAAAVTKALEKEG